MFVCVIVYVGEFMFCVNVNMFCKLCECFFCLCIYKCDNVCVNGM